MKGAATHGAHTPGERERSLRTALVFCLIDVTLMGTAAFHSNSLTILGDFLKECGDTTAVLAAFITLRAVRRAPSHRFTYGIGKLENLVSMSIVVLMTLAAIAIAVQAFYHLRHPVMPHGTVPGILIFTVYAFIAFAISFRNRRILKSQHSPIIASQAALWFSKGSFDALMAGSLITALVFRGSSWSLYLDPLASLVGVAFMIHSAYAIASESVGDLLDAALEETMQIRILKCLAAHFDDYALLHKVRTRRSGSRIYVELFLEFDPQLTMGQVRERIDCIRESVGTYIPGADVAVIPADETPHEESAAGKETYVLNGGVGPAFQIQFGNSFFWTASGSLGSLDIAKSGTAAARYALNDAIDGASTFEPSGVGRFWGDGDGYLGLRITDGSNLYYGWAGLSNSPGTDSKTATITGFAFENSPGVAILAGNTGAAVPEPGTWAAAVVLAVGAIFLRGGNTRRGTDIF